jgi:hypothetical protein
VLLVTTGRATAAKDETKALQYGAKVGVVKGVMKKVAAVALEMQGAAADQQLEMVPTCRRWRLVLPPVDEDPTDQTERKAEPQ